MPNRILKESICTSEHIDKLSWFEESLYYRLIVNCDDYGRFDGRPAVIKSRLFPLKENLTSKSVSDGIRKLASVGLVVLYVFEDAPYLYLPNWDSHQTVRAKRSKYPAPNNEKAHLLAHENICKQMQADVPVIQSESESEYEYEKETVSLTRYGKESAATPRRERFVPPTEAEAVDFFKNHGSTANEAGIYWDFYQSKGWKVGRDPMKDWKAAARNWIKRNANNAAGNSQSTAATSGKRVGVRNVTRSDAEMQAAGDWLKNSTNRTRKLIKEPEGG